MNLHLQSMFEKAATLQQQGKLAEAERIYVRILRQQPDNYDALIMLGSIAYHTKRPDRAIELQRSAINANASLPEAHSNLGYALLSMNRPAEAIASFDKAIALKPEWVAEDYRARGNALLMLNRCEEALSSFEKAVALRPDYAIAHSDRAYALVLLNRPSEAFASYEIAISRDPKLADAWLGRGNILTDLTRYDDALAAYNHALLLRPDLAGAWVGRGNVYARRGAHDKAAAEYDRALRLKPDLKYVDSDLLYAKLKTCDWTNLEAEAASLTARVRAGKLVARPFIFAAIQSSPADRLACAKLYSDDKFAHIEPLSRGRRPRHDRIRVAYLSADYRIHPVAYSISEVLELHDRQRFEVVGISFGANDKSDIRTRIARSFDQFHDVRDQTDAHVAQLLMDLEIDIAVDLNGYTDLARSGILARRPVPIQVSLLGYPATMGNNFIHYAIADSFVLPEEQQQYWTEKIVYMPDSYLPQDTVTKRNIPGRLPSRTELGLPDGAFVFCCFNSFFKITPDVFRIWMGLLKKIDGSVVWFSPANKATRANLHKAAAADGIDPNRLIFAPLLERMEDHLSRHRAADLFLDTPTYNAHTTAADALWAGLPVITCSGETFPARVAGSLLRAIGLPELVTSTLDDYEALALRLARDPIRLADTKAKVVRNRDTYPLFDSPLFTRHLERAYQIMQERHQRGEGPASFKVEPKA
jgi:predicted O-linked N-acetylglucosamine transferase (SPINDLY family)